MLRVRANKIYHPIKKLSNNAGFRNWSEKRTDVR